MLTRRLLCGCLAAGLPLAATSAFAQTASECAVFTPARQKATTPADALARLKDGNARFVSGKTVNCDLRTQVKETAAGQAPFAAIVGCIDSRVTPELVFDQRIGDIFCARIAGNFVNTDIIGSLEFATKVAGARAIVVLGHTDCGAVKGAIADVKLGNLTAMLENIRPAVQAAGAGGGARDANDKSFVQRVADTNAKLAAANLLRRSSVLKELVEAKELVIAAAMHDLSTGRVSWLNLADSR